MIFKYYVINILFAISMLSIGIISYLLDTKSKIYQYILSTTVFILLISMLLVLAQLIAEWRINKTEYLIGGILQIIIIVVGVLIAQKLIR